MLILTLMGTQVFIQLRAWRLAKKRELDTEASALTLSLTLSLNPDPEP